MTAPDMQGSRAMSVDIPEPLTRQVKRHEGFRRRVYRDTAGIETIGYGRNLRHRGVSEAEAAMLLDNDLAGVWRSCRERIAWFDALDVVRQCALVEMGFNLGFAGLMRFERMLAAMERGDFAAAAGHALDSRWAAQVKGRAETIARQIATGRAGPEASGRDR